MTTIRKSCHGCADLETETFAEPGGRFVYRCLRFGETLSNAGALGLRLKELEDGCWSEEK
jgi:hypothetical protein